MSLKKSKNKITIFKNIKTPQVLEFYTLKIILTLMSVVKFWCQKFFISELAFPSRTQEILYNFKVGLIFSISNAHSILEYMWINYPLYLL